MNDAPPVRPTPWLYALAAILRAGGAGYFGYALWQGISHVSDGLVQVVVPGEAELRLRRDRLYTVFLELQSVVNGKIYSADAVNGLECKVKLIADEAAIPMRRTLTSTSYELSGRSGRSVLEFRIPADGSYKILVQLRRDGARTGNRCGRRFRSCWPHYSNGLYVSPGHLWRIRFRPSAFCRDFYSSKKCQGSPDRFKSRSHGAVLSFGFATQSATSATCAISATSCTRTICAPPKMAAVTVAAVPQIRSSGGRRFPSCAKVAPRNPLRELPTSSG
jgi:hypothetical protein